MTRKAFAALGVGLVSLAAVGSCGVSGNPSPSHAGPAILPSADAALRAPAAPATVHVTVLDFNFHPASLSVPVGTTVVWTNKDPHQHTVTQSVDNGWGSQLMDTGDTFSHTFTRPGTYAYDCELHPFMTGTVVVTPAATSS